MDISGFLLFLGMTVMQFSEVSSVTLSYKCFPNNTILVSGLPTDSAALHYFAIQEADGTNCNVTGSIPDGTALVSACNKDEPIYFSYGSYSGMAESQIYGGQQVSTINITCIEISDSGVAKTISNNFSAAIQFQDEQTLSPEYDIISTLNPTSALVGQDVTWTIIYPASYKLQITTCTAYPGTAVHATESIVLISTWCSSISELISNFVSNGNNTNAVATMKAFKFYGYDFMFLMCDVLVCPPGSSSCTTSCSQGRRKRSESEHHGEYIKTISSVLHIADTKSAASVIISGSFVSFLLAILHLLF